MERINALLVGAPRQGKTYFGEKKLIEYAKAGGCSVVYNVGRHTDFQKFIPVEIMTVQEYRDKWQVKHKKTMPAYDIPKEVFFFKHNNQIYHLSEFSKLFAGKCVKIERVFNKGNCRNEDYFLEAIYKYFYNTFVMFDDCRTIFRNGLSAEMCGLLSRINHCGKKTAPNNDLFGVDIILTYHGFEWVNQEVYQWLNLLIQFRTMFEPTMKIDNREMQEVIEANYRELRNTPQYSHFETDLFTMNNQLFKP